MNPSQLILHWAKIVTHHSKLLTSTTMINLQESSPTQDALPRSRILVVQSGRKS